MKYFCFHCGLRRWRSGDYEAFAKHLAVHGFGKDPWPITDQVDSSYQRVDWDGAPVLTSGGRAQPGRVDGMDGWICGEAPRAA